MNLADTITANFTFRELLHSRTAEGFKTVADKPGLTPEQKKAWQAKYDAQYNPPAAIIQALTLLCQNTLQPIAEQCDKMYGLESYIKVSSGYRSPAVNAAQPNASTTSQHMQGEAADINLIVDGEERNDLLVKAIVQLQKEGRLQFDQLILEFGTPTNPQWVHISYNSNGPQRGSVLRKAPGVRGYTKYNLFK